MDQLTGGGVRKLVEQIAKALVDDPGAVRVEAVEGSQVTVLEIRTAPEDLGKVIGRQGRIVNAIRTLLGSIGMKIHKRFKLDVIGSDIPSNDEENDGSPTRESGRSPTIH